MRSRLKVYLLFFFSLCSVNLIAQKMTDNQVVQYVMEQREKGKDQQTIANDLAKKGVTADQMVRIRNKYQAQNSLLGASDVTGKSANNTKNSVRTQK